jgi:hypothetical protein
MKLSFNGTVNKLFGIILLSSLPNIGTAPVTRVPRIVCKTYVYKNLSVLILMIQNQVNILEWCKRAKSFFCFFL